MNPIQMPLVVAPIFEQYYPEETLCRQILVEHSYRVAQKALEIARLHPHWDLNLEFIEEAAWLHDIGVDACHAPKIGCYGERPYIYHGLVGAERLRAAGLEAHALVAERHTGTGLYHHTILQRGWDFPADRVYVPQSLEEIIVCVADKFFSKTEPTEEKSYEQILRGLSRFGEDDVIRFKAWYKMLFDTGTSAEAVEG